MRTTIRNLCVTMVVACPWLAGAAGAAEPARDITFISTSDPHYREPDHKAGCHNDLNRLSVEAEDRRSMEHDGRISCRAGTGSNCK